MSFYPHPHYFQQRRSVAHPTSPYTSAAGPGHYGHGHHQSPFATPSPAPQFNFYNSGNDYYPTYEAPTPPRAHQDVDRHASIDDEERAAIAHLRSIQRRKEAERIIREEAERERAIAQLQARREAAIAAKVRAHQEREREIALARARIEKERELAFARQVKQIELAQQAAIENQRRQQHLQIAARAHQEQRRQCARQCAARRTEQERSTPNATNPAFGDEGLDEINRFFGSLFGVQLDSAADKSEAPAAPTPEVKKDEPAAAPVTFKPNEAVAPTPAVTESAPVVEPTTKPTADEKKADFPDVINDVLTNFLGLRVEPESKLGQAVSNKVPEGLNELLGQFGLEFFPDTSSKTEAGPSEAKEADTAASAAAAAQTSEQQPRHPFDLSEFLNGDNGLPPFVRDILGNVEQAFKNDKNEREPKVEGKGKGVAEGEKKAAPASVPAPQVPAPVPAVAEEDKSTSSTTSIDKLESIASEIKLARDSFTFPSALSFSHNAPTDNVPSLLFNKQNKPYHAQNNKLLQLLLQADGVASNGDREVRRKRKEVVKLVEAELEGLEKKRDEIWREVKERREGGNESSDDESSSWTTGSTVDHEEPVHVEDVGEPSQVVEPKSEEAAATTTETAQSVTNEKDPSPTSFAEAVKSGPEPIESEAKAEDTHVPAVAEQKTTKTDEEQGYELL